MVRIKQLNRISMISPRSVLALYLEKKALSEQLSVIEGPPGTGKTQTILNIIANAIINNKTVAVVSNNNSATANVIEKLQKYGVGFFAAYLGNRENKEKFFAEQKERLNELLEYKNQLASLKTELSSLLTEQEYFDKYYVDTNGKPLKLHSILKINVEKVMSLLVDYQFMSKTGKIPIWGKVINLIRYGIFNFSIYDNDTEINMVMLLRPTESPTIFLQQLGRGLRKSNGKKYLNVLDFIGNYKSIGLIPNLHTGEYLNSGKPVIPPENSFPEDCIIDFDFRIIDLFKKLELNKIKLKDKLIEEYAKIKELVGETPSRVDLYAKLDDEVWEKVKANSSILKLQL